MESINKQHGVSCIIPAYNEESRIMEVINAVVDHPLVDEVIVVNDGSTDGTDSLVKSIQKIKLISLPQNHGKSYAVMIGLKESRNDLVMMLDADLVKLHEDDITALIKPVLENKADMTLSLRQNSLRFYKLFGLEFVSGERVFNKNIIRNLDELKSLFGFGLESYLNKIIIKQKLRIKVVRWKHTLHTLKSKKMGYWNGLKTDLKMSKDIISYLSLTGAIIMFIKMLRLKVRD